MTAVRDRRSRGSGRRNRGLVMKALVVDDSGVIRKIVSRALNQLNVESVIQADDGHGAVKAVTEHGSDIGVILLDWNMPNKNGYDALREIRAMGCRTPVIMVTTEAEKSRVLEAIKAGANNYVVKPFTPDTIQKKVKDTCPQWA